MLIERYANKDGTMCVRASDGNYVYERVEVGVDGDCGYALLGPNIQEGECEFVKIEASDNPTFNADRAAWGIALSRLRDRLGGYIPYFIKS